MSECMLHFGPVSYTTNTAIVGYNNMFLYMFSYKTRKYQKIKLPNIQNVFIFDDHDYVYIINSEGLKIYSLEDGKLMHAWNQKNISSLISTDKCISINGITILMHDWRIISKSNISDAGSNNYFTWLHYNNGKLEIIYKHVKKLDTYYNVISVSGLREAIYFSDYNHHYRLIDNDLSSYCRLEGDSDVMSGGVILRNNQQYYLDALSLELLLLEKTINSIDDYRYLIFEHEEGLNIVDPNYGFAIGYIPNIQVKTDCKLYSNYMKIDDCIYSYSGLNLFAHKFCEYKDNSWYYNVNFPIN